MFIRKLSEKLSNFMRASLIVVGTIFGVKRLPNGKYNNKGAVSAGWIFIVGLPIGITLLGPYFSMVTWLLIIAIVLAIVNLDDALLQLSSLIENGVDGVIE